VEDHQRIGLLVEPGPDGIREVPPTSSRAIRQDNGRGEVRQEGRELSGRDDVEGDGCPGSTPDELAECREDPIRVRRLAPRDGHHAPDVRVSQPDHAARPAGGHGRQVDEHRGGGDHSEHEMHEEGIEGVEHSLRVRAVGPGQPE
jgi:hypothetical protein